MDYRSIEFKPLLDNERTALLKALRGNGKEEWSILMNPKDTSFVGYTTDDVAEDEVVQAIKSVPMHY